MRILAIGDIHGCLRALDLLLDAVQPQSDDVLVTLGDYIDRGPDSKGVLDRLIELQGRCGLVALKGNHDLMMLAARADHDHFQEWLPCGGKQTLASYGADLAAAHFAQAVPDRHWHFLTHDCRPFHQIDTHFFVHANVIPDIALDEQPDYMLYWEKLSTTEARPHISGKIMICGHTVQRSGRPLELDHAIDIDTWVYGDGWLTCLDVLRSAYWQTNQRGDRRTGMLEFRNR